MVIKPLKNGAIVIDGSTRGGKVKLPLLSFLDSGKLPYYEISLYDGSQKQKEKRKRVKESENNPTFSWNGLNNSPKYISGNEYDTILDSIHRIVTNWNDDQRTVR